MGMRNAHGILKIEVVMCVVYYGHRGYGMSGAAARTGDLKEKRAETYKKECIGVLGNT